MTARLCISCPTPIGPRNASGRCRSCAALESSRVRHGSRPPKVCIDCKCKVSRHSKGRCRPCANLIASQDPEREARRLAASCAVTQSPGYSDRIRTQNAARRRPAVERICSDCPATITVQSKGGRCRACANRAASKDPAREARRIAALRLAHQQPEYRAKKSEENKARHQQRKNDPAWQEYLREQGRRVQAVYRASPEAQARRKEASAGVGQKLRAQRLAWCPAELRDEYSVLRRRWGADKARAVIEEKIPGTDAYVRKQMIARAPVLAEAAADFLRKLGPVFRCDANGKLNRNGQYWRRGSATLSCVAIVQRAADRGWQPEAWRRIG